MTATLMPLLGLLLSTGCAMPEGDGLATGEVRQASTSAMMGAASCNDRVRLKSWKGDYLHRPDGPPGVTTWSPVGGSIWTVECVAGGRIQLRSWKGDYLHRPDSPQGVTTWSQGEWSVESLANGNIQLRSWKGDYLHRPDGPPGVTTWGQGEWTVEVVVMGAASCNDRVRLKSWKGDYLHRPDGPQGVSTWDQGPGNNWTVECVAGGRIQLRSWKGDYLHRPDSPQGVTTWSQGEWSVENLVNGTIQLRSWKGDYLHRPDGPPGVTTWDQGQWTVEPLPEFEQAALAVRFAPRLRFDGAAHGYPMSAQTFYNLVVLGQSTARVENTDPSTLGSGQIPTYYQVIECGAQVRIKYWWFYGYQSSCDAFDNGSHNGDWENVVVTLSEDRSTVAAVTFSMHGHTYTRLASRGGFSVEDSTHPVVYVGKKSHAAHYTQGGSSDTCLPWEEYRNNTSGLHLDSWSNLVNLDRDSGPSDWIVADRQGGFVWGPDGISNHPTRNGPSCSMNAADWTVTVPTWWHSQCKTGDRDDGTRCHTQCRPGYTDMGLTCTNWDIFSLHTYNQNLYGYDYTLPTSDVGLLTNDYD